MKVTIYIQARKWSWDREWTVEAKTHQAETCDDRTCVDLSEVEIDIPVPALDHKKLVMVEVEQLQEQIKKEMAESHVRITSIEEKIQSLLCIENQE